MVGLSVLSFTGNRIISMGMIVKIDNMMLMKYYLFFFDHAGKSRILLKIS